MPPPDLPPLHGLPVEVLVGGPLATLDTRPLPVCDPQVLDFLAALSQRLLHSPSARAHPDVAAFGYWCRRAHLRQMAAMQAATGQRRLGRGLALHIAPANVPVNFAYSLAFGLLAGNANLVRVPEADTPQARLLCEALATLLAEPAHARLAAMTRVVRYPRDDAVTGALSARCQVRVLWGGDATITHLRGLPIPPRAVEVTFADRYSLCALGADAVLAASDAALQRLAADFYNDAYTLDQAACSSPQLVVWLGDAEAVARAQARFWPALAAVVQARYRLAPVAAVDKFSQLCDLALALPEARAATRHGNAVHRLALDALPAGLHQHRGRHGLFLEYRANDLACLATVADAKAQTLTCFGIDPHAVADSVLAAGLHGIDRVVPVGRALDIGVFWDGYDLIGTMSRVVAVG